MKQLYLSFNLFAGSLSPLFEVFLPESSGRAKKLPFKDDKALTKTGQTVTAQRIAACLYLTRNKNYAVP